MPAAFTCNACGGQIFPDGTGVLAWTEGSSAAVVHSVCYPRARFKVGIDRLRRAPLGVIADVLSSPSARPWYDELPASVRTLAQQIFDNERRSAAEGK
jgi:hypothetical protein